MKVLVVGGGGREHALIWKVAQSPLVSEVIAAPGNGGIASHARCVAIGAEDVDGQVALAKKEQVGLVVIGPEAPLVDGLADRLAAEGILAFGPSAAAAQLEGSKAFAKEFMERHQVPTAAFSVHGDLDSAVQQVDRRAGPCVVKADGLAAGKGVIVCRSPYEARQAVREMLGEGRFGEAGARVVIEDLLEGEEVSVLALCDGDAIVPLIAAQDHKAAFEGDSGPNTGGMGAYAPAPVVDAELAGLIHEQVLRRTVEGMAADGMPFKGVLYAGLMIVDGRPQVLEFNVRFGDPECQPLMVMMKDDLVPLLVASAEGRLAGREMDWHDGAAICVVLAADGYPGTYKKGRPISGLAEAAEIENLVVFHAGTKLDGEQLVTSGGRVLGVTGRGADLQQAAGVAYTGAAAIGWEGMRFRRDIGHRALT
jgi:phosphoribosylamine--glycine ligase